MLAEIYRQHLTSIKMCTYPKVFEERRFYQSMELVVELICYALDSFIVALRCFYWTSGLTEARYTLSALWEDEVMAEVRTICLHAASFTGSLSSTDLTSPLRAGVWPRSDCCVSAAWEAKGWKRQARKSAYR